MGPHRADAATCGSRADTAEVVRLVETRGDRTRTRASSPGASAAATATPRRTAVGDVVRCTQLDRVLELDVAKGRCTVEAGVSIEMLMRVFFPLGWFPMVVPGTRFVTVGGAIASDIHGKFRHGSFADSVERMTIATPEHGVVIARPDDDVFWATAGGMGRRGALAKLSCGTLGTSGGRTLRRRFQSAIGETGKGPPSAFSHSLAKTPSVLVSGTPIKRMRCARTGNDSIPQGGLRAVTGCHRTLSRDRS